MYQKTIYLPTICEYTLIDADGYIRSAFTIPRLAYAVDQTTTTGVLIVAYFLKDERVAEFTCYPMYTYDDGKWKLTENLKGTRAKLK